jgi:uncharacterized membrane protein
MERKFYKNWFVSFIVLFVIDVVWHRGIFNSFYVSTMGQVVRVTSGALSPLLHFIAVGDVAASLGYVSLVIPTSMANKRFLMNGAIAGLAIHGSFTLWNYALIPQWGASLTAFDILYAILQGSIQGFLLQRLNPLKA